MLKFLIPIFFLSSCFRVGIPEKFYTSQNIQNTNLLPKVFIVKSDKDDVYKIFDNKTKPALGNQFVLGVFPLTRIYLEHGAESFFIESIAQNLLSKGVVPILLSKRDSQSLNCPWIEIGSKPEIDFYVYDLLVTRLVKLNASASIKMKNGFHHNLEVNSHDYYSQAQYPQLANFMQFETDQVLSESRINNYILNNFCNSIKQEDTLVVNFPRVSSRIEKEIPEDFLNAFKHQRFNNSMLARLMQRGAETALDKDYRVMSVLAGELSARNKINIELLKLEVENNNFLKLSLAFDFNYKGLKFRDSCEVKQELDRSRDGAEIIAVEKAVYYAVKKLLSNQC